MLLFIFCLLALSCACLVVILCSLLYLSWRFVGCHYMQMSCVRSTLCTLRVINGTHTREPRKSAYAFVSQCLRKDAESRRRDLHIRTYAVIPLNEECGIIEWVNNTAGLRHILTKLYKEKGVSSHILLPIPCSLIHYTGHLSCLLWV